MIRAGGEAAQARMERELAEANLKRLQQQQKNLRELGPIQRQANRIASSNAFGKVSIALIAAFSILLAFAQPTEPPDTGRNASIKVAENVFTVLFTIEVCIVWVAAGPFRFFTDGWNVFDFFIVGIGWLTFTDIGQDVPLACMRVARLLRPLRTLNRVEGLKRLVDCLFASIPGIANVGGMIMSFVFVVSLFGLKMFKGLMKFRCVELGEVLNYNATLSMAMPCDSCEDHGLVSPNEGHHDLSIASMYINLNLMLVALQVCDEIGNPNYGFSSFDSMPVAALLIFQVITLEGWTELMDVLMDVSMDGLVGVYFGVIVCVGAFFLTNYLLAQVCLVFTSKLKVAKALE